MPPREATPLRADENSGFPRNSGFSCSITAEGWWNGLIAIGRGGILRFNCVIWNPANVYTVVNGKVFSRNQIQEKLRTRDPEDIIDFHAFTFPSRMTFASADTWQPEALIVCHCCFTIVPVKPLQTGICQLQYLRFLPGHSPGKSGQRAIGSTRQCEKIVLKSNPEYRSASRG